MSKEYLNRGKTCFERTRHLTKIQKQAMEILVESKDEQIDYFLRMTDKAINDQEDLIHIETIDVLTVVLIHWCQSYGVDRVKDLFNQSQYKTNKNRQFYESIMNEFVNATKN